jgi:hypothetical protein
MFAIQHFGITPDLLTCQIPRRWCANGVSPDRHNVKNLTLLHGSDLWRKPACVCSSDAALGVLEEDLPRRAWSKAHI